MRDLAERRSQGEDPTYGTVLLNELVEAEDYFFGELVRFEQGAQLTMLSMTGGGRSYNLVQARAPDGHEPLKGTLYFMVFGNHVTLLQNDIGAGRLEKYLRWLLTVAAPIVTPSANIVLAAEIEVVDGTSTLPLIEKIAISPTPLRSADFDQAVIATGTDGPRGVSRQSVSAQRTLSVLQAAGVDDADIHRFLEQKTEIRVTVEIDFKDGRKNKPIGMETIGRVFRNIDPDDLVLRGPKGAQIKGDLTGR
ncbi:hypothetical protein [Muricoccus roseus]|nr:hypothetical protein [Roseomonas rosea]